MNSAKYPVIQFNGQRVYCPSPLTKPLPRGTEIFVGNLPKDIFEDDLIERFSKAGPIYKLRLMMNFSGQTRGFAFITYYNIEDARKAILLFNKTSLRSGSKMAVVTVHFSLNNCKLFLGNIPRDKTGDEIAADLSKFVDGVVGAVVYADSVNPSINRGFAFVEFESHAMAAIARRRLWSGLMPVWENRHRFHVEWAEPEPIVDPFVLMQVQILYVKNIPLNWGLDEFKRFIVNVKVNGLTKIHKKDSYAFIHFSSREAAEAALNTLNDVLKHPSCKDYLMKVEWARPPCYSRKQTAKRPPDTTCKSVPPRARENLLTLRNNGRGRHRCLTSGGNPSPQSAIETVEEFLALNLDPISEFIRMSSSITDV